MNGANQPETSLQAVWQAHLLTVMHLRAAGADLSTVLDAVVNAVVSSLDADGVRLVLAGEDNTLQVFSAGALAATMASGDVSALEVAAAKEWFGWSDIAASWDDAQRLGTVAGCALRIAGGTRGVLWCGLAEEKTFNESQAEWLTILAGQAAEAIEAQRLRQAERMLAGVETVFRCMPDPVLIVDADLRVRASNPAARRLFAGLEAGDGGQLLQGIAELTGLADLVRAGEGQAVPREYSVDDDHCYAVTVGSVPDLADMHGWRVVILQDTTRFRRLHDSMADFLSSVSHDMRTPLTYMKGYLDMLSMVGPVNEKQAEFLGIIAGGFAQMSDMVEKILKAGRLDPVTGTYTLERDACDLTEIVREVASALAAPAAAKQLALSTTIGEGIPIVNVDRELINSAMMNLAENAVKYTPEGGTVAILLDVQDGQVVFRVKDNGLGISSEDQQKLFRRNVRIHRKEWRRVKGSGLGLFIVRNVARRHGGDAWVESVEGQGSTFTFAIPLEGANLIGAETGAQ